MKKILPEAGGVIFFVLVVKESQESSSAVVETVSEPGTDQLPDSTSGSQPQAYDPLHPDQGPLDSLRETPFSAELIASKEQLSLLHHHVALLRCVVPK